MRVAKAQTGLHICADSSESLQLADVISNGISCTSLICTSVHFHAESDAIYSILDIE